MPKIKGKFAPLMADLANDERWLIQCTDDQKFLYQLILFTIYTTNGTAPDDPNYYKVRYNLARRKHSISTDLAQLKALFPKLVSTEKKLSLLNSVVYENRVTTSSTLEVDKEVDIDKEVESKTSDNHTQTASSADSELGEIFSVFWSEYPRKVAKKDAFRAFKRVFKSHANTKIFFEAVLLSLKAQKKSEDWKRDNGKYIPFPATWLNGERWEDKQGEINVSTKTTTNFHAENTADFERELAKARSERLKAEAQTGATAK